MQLALVFPGQGSQRPGMGKALADAYPAARAVFEEVDDAIGQHLSRMIFEGPDADLTRTDNAQPALLAVSMAVVAVLRGDAGLDPARDCRFVAGHSLGEYCALAAAGALTVADAARTLRARGLAMRRAVPGDAGAMVAVLGAEIGAVEDAAAAAARETGGVCVVANDNAPGQVVLSGNTVAVERAGERAREAGARRVVRLDVGGAFHSPLMGPAAEEMADILQDLPLLAPRPPVVANVTAAPTADAAGIRRLLFEQITGRVRWRESVVAMVAAGTDTMAEVGAGKVLTGLSRRIAPELATFAVETPEEVEAFVRAR